MSKSGIMKPIPMPATGEPNLRKTSGFEVSAFSRRTIIRSRSPATSDLSFGTITPIPTPELALWAMFFGVVVSVVFALYPA